MKNDIQILKGDFGHFKQKKLIGYYWMSDQKYPALIESPQQIDFSLFDRTDPYAFVVEAMFIDSEKEESLVIKSIDDKRFSYAISWQEIEGYTVKKEQTAYVKDPKNKKLQFKSLYKKTASPTAAGFATEEFACRAFVGFQG